VGARWLDQWRTAEEDTHRAIALRSPRLAESIEHYLAGFAENFDNFYAGINALAMLKVQLHLAKQLPAIWAENFDDNEKAEEIREECERRADRIAAALYLTLGMDSTVRRKDEKSDIWKEISRADLLFFTLERPSLVARAYRNVLENAKPFHVDAARRNVLLFRELGLMSANVQQSFDQIQQFTPLNLKTPVRVLLFTGHMLDSPQRPADKARFPCTPGAEKTAHEMIEEAIRKEINEEGGVTLGVAGGACGGDILFHETCESLKIPTLLFLALPEDRFQVESVDRAGPGWVERYRKLCQRVPPRVLANSKELPRWLADKRDYNIWQRCNLWIMFDVLAMDACNLTLIGLYNRECEPDGPGGTAHLIDAAAKWGFKTLELDARKLLKA
jgi:hypothetical protein